MPRQSERKQSRKVARRARKVRSEKKPVNKINALKAMIIAKLGTNMSLWIKLLGLGLLTVGGLLTIKKVIMKKRLLNNRNPSLFYTSSSSEISPITHNKYVKREPMVVEQVRTTRPIYQQRPIVRPHTVARQVIDRPITQETIIERPLAKRRPMWLGLLPLSLLIPGALFAFKRYNREPKVKLYRRSPVMESDSIPMPPPAPIARKPLYKRVVPMRRTAEVIPVPPPAPTAIVKNPLYKRSKKRRAEVIPVPPPAPAVVREPLYRRVVQKRAVRQEAIPVPPPAPAVVREPLYRRVVPKRTVRQETIPVPPPAPAVVAKKPLYKRVTPLNLISRHKAAYIPEESAEFVDAPEIEYAERAKVKTNSGRIPVRDRLKSRGLYL